MSLLMNLACSMATAIHAVQSIAITGNELMRLRKIALTPVESSTKP